MPFEESLASDSRGIGLGMLPGARWAVIMTNPGWLGYKRWVVGFSWAVFFSKNNWLVNLDVGDDILPSYNFGDYFRTAMSHRDSVMNQSGVHGFGHVNGVLITGVNSPLLQYVGSVFFDQYRWKATRFKSQLDPAKRTYPKMLERSWNLSTSFGSMIRIWVPKD